MTRNAGDVHTEVIRRLQGLAADALQGAGGDTSFALVDFPDHPNVGDSAIWLGTTEYFRLHTHREPRYVATIANFDEAALRAAVPAGPIFVHGGGNFGDLWPRHQEFRERLLERFADREVIQLPQSLHFDDPAVAKRAAAAIARHGRFRLFVRDEWSYEFATAHFECEVALCPDMTVFIGDLGRETPSKDVLYLLRTDKEGAPHPAPGRPGYTSQVADWLSEPRLTVGLQRWRAMARGVWRGRRDREALRLASYDGAAVARVARGCELLSRGRVVITDRLHAHLLSFLLRIPHAVLDNTYGKPGRFLDLWMPDAPDVYRAASLEEAEQWAADTVHGVEATT